MSPKKAQKQFKILPHTADARLLIFGNSYAEIFQNALLGMKAILQPEEDGEETGWRKIKIESMDPTALLVDFLSEVLYLIQTNHEIYDELKIFELTQCSLEAALKGKKFKNIKEEIKAVTYHEAYVQQKTDNKWEAMVIFDL
ncbi:MAG: archease [Patescibacteria group bacterium]|jgi:SHS2 domain-containing protein|nr:archease [Patescibacteria group bacterium]